MDKSRQRNGVAQDLNVDILGTNIGAPFNLAENCGPQFFIGCDLIHGGILVSLQDED
jgi:hypothetical protein